MALVFKSGAANNTADLFSILRTLLGSTLNSTPPLGLGWQETVVSATESIFYSEGTSGLERIYLGLKVSDDGLSIKRTIYQSVSPDGVDRFGAVGNNDATKIIFGNNKAQYWIIGNKDFLHLITLPGINFCHNYAGIINRYSPSHITYAYGDEPVSQAPWTHSSSDFELGENSAVYIFEPQQDHNLVIGQRVMIIDNSYDTLTSGNIAVATFNGYDENDRIMYLNRITGASSFSTFTMIGIDPQPVVLNTYGSIKSTNFYALNNATLELQNNNYFIDLDCGSQSGEQGAGARGLYIGYPLKLKNDSETRGSLFGLFDVPLSLPGPLDYFKTADGLYKFINFPDGLNSCVAIGSIK